MTSTPTAESRVERDLTGPGTPVEVWRRAGLPDRLPVVELAALRPATGRVVVLAPHPDDETLGVGGIIARLAGSGSRLLILSATDGEASHPGRPEELGRIRTAERAGALAALGLPEAAVHRLGLPDAAVSAEAVAAGLAALLRPGDVLLAPWQYDGHPDHDACGSAALQVGAHLGVPVWSYLVWAWHWAAPHEIPWERAFRVPFAIEIAEQKRRAIQQFVSQVDGDDPILPTHVLRRLPASDEVLLAEQR